MQEEKINLLDHGYIQFIESWGSDERIVEAARMSTGKGFNGWGQEEKCSTCDGTGKGFDQDCSECQGKGRRIEVSGDEKLLRYLYEHKHATPFEMAGLVVEVQAPIFVFREWHRHRTQSYNEMSARYTPLPDLNYIPTLDRLMLNSKTNKQAGTIKGAAELTEDQARTYQDLLRKQYEADQTFYEQALGWGVPKELARIHLPVGRFSRMRASANIRNWLAFLTLRMDVNAQWEIRQYANTLGTFIAARYPHTWDLFARSDVFTAS